MLNLPEWASGYISKKGCPNCGTSMGNSKITFLGIKESDDGKYYLCFEALCLHCNTTANTTILTDVDFTAKQLAAEIFSSCRDDVQDVQHHYVSPLKKSKKNKKPIRMSAFNKESSKFIDFLKSCENYEELLKEIGLTDEEIRKYGYGK